MKKSNKVTFLTQAAVIAAIYVVLTIIFAPFSFGEVQVRISEALTVLPFFTPFMMLTVGIGEVLSCGVIGLVLQSALKNYSHVIFRDTAKA